MPATQSHVPREPHTKAAPRDCATSAPKTRHGAQSEAEGITTQSATVRNIDFGSLGSRRSAPLASAGRRTRGSCWMCGSRPVG